MGKLLAFTLVQGINQCQMFGINNGFEFDLSRMNDLCCIAEIISLTWTQYSYAVHLMTALVIFHLKAEQYFCYACIEKGIYKIIQYIYVYLCILLFLVFTVLQRCTIICMSTFGMLKSWYYDKKPPQCHVLEQISQKKGSLSGCFDSASTQNNL